MSLAYNSPASLMASPYQRAPALAARRKNKEKENMHHKHSSASSNKNQALANPLHRRRRVRQVASVSNQDPKVRAMYQEMGRSKEAATVPGPSTSSTTRMRRSRPRVVSSRVPKPTTVPSSASSQAPHLNEVPEEMEMEVDGQPIAGPSPKTAPSHAAASASNTAPQSVAQTYDFPRVLPRYNISRVSDDALSAVDPELKDAPVQFVVDELDQKRSRLHRGLASVHVDNAPLSGGPVPRRITLRVESPKDGRTDIDPIFPTHILAAVNPKTREGTLYPIHDLLFASHCSYLPRFSNHPSRSPSGSTSSSPKGKTTSLPTPNTSDVDEDLPVYPPQVEYREDGSASITLPVVLVELPHPNGLHNIYDWLYNKQSSRLLSRLVPLSKEALVWVGAQTLAAVNQVKATASSAPTTAPSNVNIDADEDNTPPTPLSESSSPPPSPQSLLVSQVRADMAVRIAAQQASSQAQPSNDVILKRNMSIALAHSYTFLELVDKARDVHAMWANGYMLGVDGSANASAGLKSAEKEGKASGMWETMDFAWGVILNAMVIRNELEKNVQQQQQAAAQTSS